MSKSGLSHTRLSYHWTYALPTVELVKSGIMLQAKCTNSKSVKLLGERAGGRNTAMVSIDDRSEQPSDRLVPGACEKDLVASKGGKSVIGTPMERHSSLELAVPVGGQEGPTVSPNSRSIVPLACSP